MTKDEVIEEMISWCDGLNMFESYELSIAKNNATQLYDTIVSKYAKQQCIAFAEWLSNHPLILEPSSGKGEWIGLDFKIVSSTALFEQFLTETSI